MMRELGDGYELDDDPARIDVDAVHAYLTRSYWAEGRPRETVERLVRAARRASSASVRRRRPGRLLRGRSRTARRWRISPTSTCCPSTAAAGSASSSSAR